MVDTLRRYTVGPGPRSRRRLMKEWPLQPPAMGAGHLAPLQSARPSPDIPSERQAERATSCPSPSDPCRQVSGATSVCVPLGHPTRPAAPADGPEHPQRPHLGLKSGRHASSPRIAAICLLPPSHHPAPGVSDPRGTPPSGPSLFRDRSSQSRLGSRGTAAPGGSCSRASQNL